MRTAPLDSAWRVLLLMLLQASLRCYLVRSREAEHSRVGLLSPVPHTHSAAAAPCRNARPTVRAVQRHEGARRACSMPLAGLTRALPAELSAEMRWLCSLMQQR